MARISFMVAEKTLYQTTAYCNFPDVAKTPNSKIVSNKAAE